MRTGYWWLRVDMLQNYYTTILCTWAHFTASIVREFQSEDNTVIKPKPSYSPGMARAICNSQTSYTSIVHYWETLKLFQRPNSRDTAGVGRTTGITVISYGDYLEDNKIMVYEEIHILRGLMIPIIIWTYFPAIKRARGENDIQELSDVVTNRDNISVVFLNGWPYPIKLRVPKNVHHYMKYRPIILILKNVQTIASVIQFCNESNWRKIWEPE